MTDSSYVPFGIPGGMATLNSSGKVPDTQLDFTALDFKGSWNAATNTPSLSDGTGGNGDIYICAVTGTQNLGHGNVTFSQGDLVIHDMIKWNDVGSVVNLVDYYTKEQINSLLAALSIVANTGSYTDLLNKPTITNTFNGRSGAVIPVTNDYTFAEIGSKPTTLSGYGIIDAYPLTGNPSSFLTTIPAQSFSSLIGKPTTRDGYGITDVPLSSSLSAVATSGSYTDLSNKPIIPIISTGSYTVTGVALQVIYSFPHGLGYNPSFVGVEMGSIGAALPYMCTWDGTNVTVTYISSPGVVSLIIKWFAIK